MMEQRSSLHFIPAVFFLLLIFPAGNAHAQIYDLAAWMYESEGNEWNRAHGTPRMMMVV
jgi:hypothetical protein